MSALNFLPNITGFKQKNPNATTIFSTNSFEVETFISDRSEKDYSSSLGSFGNYFTLSGIGLNSVTQSKEILGNNVSVFLNIDRTNLSNYATFGSLQEKFKYTINRIIQGYPAGLFVSPIVENKTKLTVLDFNYNQTNDISNFKIPELCLVNKFDLTYLESLTGDTGNIKNIKSNVNEFVILYDGFEFPIIGFTGSTGTGYIYVQTKGRPFYNFFTASTTNFFSTGYHLKPKGYYLDFFINSLDELEAYLLNRSSNPIYTAKFKTFEEVETGRIVSFDKEYTWPVSDGYNIDIDTPIYTTYLEELNKVAIDYDTYKSSLISRFLTSPNLFEYDTEDQRYYTLLQTYGYQFDKTKNFIDGLIYCNKVSYDKKENISDTLIVNLAKTLGWAPISTFSDTNLLDNFLNSERFFNKNVSKELTPAEVDVELWRRIVINTAWLFRNKGTRKSILFLLNLIGIDEEVVTLNEYIYKTIPIDPLLAQNLLDNSLDEATVPTDSSGYPKILSHDNNYYFQCRGKWYAKIETINENNDAIGGHTDSFNPLSAGTTGWDYGSSYFKPFQDTGFPLIKVVDNIKSWPVFTGTTNRTSLVKDYETSYEIADERLVLNTKFIDLTLDVAKKIDIDLFNFYQKCNPTSPDFCEQYVVLDYVLPGYVGCELPFPSVIDVNSFSFLNFLDYVLKNFVDVRNRKVISDNLGGGYPTLRALYDVYHKSSRRPAGASCKSNALDYDDVVTMFDKMDNFWNQLISQLIPATTIYSGVAIEYRNSIFHTQKFVYRRGIFNISGNTIVGDMVNEGVNFATRHEESITNPKLKPIDE